LTAANQQILTAYEDCGMTPEQIAEDFNYELQAVKMILLAHSQAFSDKQLTKDNKREDSSNDNLFSDTDLQLAKNTIKELASSAEIEAVKFRAAEFIINEKKGRNDVKNLRDMSNGINITIISETMSRAREAMAKAKQRAIEMKEVHSVSSECIAG